MKYFYDDKDFMCIETIKSEFSELLYTLNCELDQILDKKDRYIDKLEDEIEELKERIKGKNEAINNLKIELELYKQKYKQSNIKALEDKLKAIQAIFDKEVD